MVIEQHVGGYPGRGLLLHLGADDVLGWAYFVTGRSEASRQRRLRHADDGLLIESTQPDAADDPQRYYTCARHGGDYLVVGNGDHVDLITNRLAAGATPHEIIELLEPEPDPPIHTPRVALCVGPTPVFLAVHRGEADVVRRVIPVRREPRTAMLLTTYSGSVEAPTGDARVRVVAEERSLEVLARDLWSSLDPALRVLLVAGEGTDLHRLLHLSA